MQSPDATPPASLYPSGEEAPIMQALGKAFFEVVPDRFRTYCALNSQIALAALKDLGIPAFLQPCQIWLVTQTNNFVVGFTGQSEHQPKWDGHVICRTASWFIDAAVHHFRVEFGMNVPTLIVGNTFRGNLAAIARCDLRPGERIWWMQPPPGIQVVVPQEPVDLISPLAAALVQRVREKLST